MLREIATESVAKWALGDPREWAIGGMKPPKIHNFDSLSEYLATELMENNPEIQHGILEAVGRVVEVGEKVERDPKGLIGTLGLIALKRMFQQLSDLSGLDNRIAGRNYYTMAYGRKFEEAANVWK